MGNKKRTLQARKVRKYASFEVSDYLFEKNLTIKAISLINVKLITNSRKHVVFKNSIVIWYIRAAYFFVTLMTR